MIRWWLWGHGIRVSGVINQDRHLAQVNARPGGRRPSKNPAAFGIDLHVDDLIGVRLEGERHGFPVVVIDPADLDWTAKVRQAVDQSPRA
jgi:hypothetical protein